jgi:RNA polymerase sigma-70 factor (ECF subfamily)
VQVALTLRTVCGLTTAQVARLSHKRRGDGAAASAGKQKIRPQASYAVPERELEQAARCAGGIYLVFTEGRDLARLMRPDLARGDRLARLIDALMPERGEIKGLLALMLLRDARASRDAAATSCC